MPLHLRRQRIRLIGYAVLEKDVISGSRRWVTYDDKNRDRHTLEPKEPIVLLPDVVEEGTCIRIYLEK